MDVHSSEQRNRNMTAIHSRDTKPERLLRSYLFRQGFRFRKNVQSLPGKPDIVLPKYKTVIFVNGCFWHGHKDCRYFQWPETNKDFWKDKITANITRDKENNNALRDEGWNVITVWECDLRNDKREKTLLSIAAELRSINHQYQQAP